MPLSDVNGLVSARSCSWRTSWNQPLVDPHENYVNPCFLMVAISGWNLFIGACCVFQALNLCFNNKFGYNRIRFSFGNPFSAQSVGLVQLSKLFLVGLQFIGLLLLFLNSDKSNKNNHQLSIQAAVLVLAVFPLHVVESTRTVVANTSLLFYWLVSSVFALVVAIVDATSPYKVYDSASGSAVGIEVCMLVNSLLILYLEHAWYSPARELIDYFELNEWDVKRVYNWFDDVTFWWMDPVIKKVYKSDHLEYEDLPPAIANLEVEHAHATFSKYWNSAVESAKRRNKDKDVKDLHVSLYWSLLKADWVRIIRGVFWNLMDFTLSFVQPFLLQQFLIFYTNYLATKRKDVPGPPAIQGAFYALMIFLASTGRFISFNRFFSNIFIASLVVRTELSTKIYEKAMRLSPEARKGKTTGDIVNNMSVDVSNLESINDTMIGILTDPLRLIICLVSLYKVLGNATWFGFVVSVILMPLCTWVNSKLYWYYNKNMEYKDERTRLTTDIFNSIKSIKLYSWEKPMIERMNEVRNNKELRLLQQSGILEAFIMLLWHCIPFFVTCVCLISFALVIHGALYPSVIFPALALLQLLSGPISELPMQVSHLIEANVSNRRLSKLFLLKELDTSEVHRSHKKLKAQDVALKIKDATFVWDAVRDDKTDQESPIALKDINFEARKGELSCIVGNVGSGKSTFLKAIIGEIKMKPSPESFVETHGSIAYCSQNPWISNGTIRENILFGSKYDKEFYQQTLEACQLLPDLKILADGDHTSVGEKGISLSGGQKARVSLARAVYSRAEIYLFDDILSAVDAHVGKNIIKKVLSGTGLLSSRTLILATNNVNVLKHSDQILLLKEGNIVERGVYQNIMSTDSELSRLIKDFSRENEEDGVDTSELPTPVIDSGVQTPVVEDGEPITSKIDFTTAVARRQSIGAASAVSFGHEYGDEFDDLDEDYRLTKQAEEKSAKGKVNFKVYLEYFKACHFGYIFVYILFYTIMVASEVGMNYILKYWSDMNLEAGGNVKPVFYVAFYTITGLTGTFFYFLGSLVIWKYSAIEGSKYFHDKMFTNVLRSPMSFFETTPIGRILNRFTEDITTLDQVIMWQCVSLVDLGMHTMALFGVIVINLPMMIFVIIVLAVIYNSYRSYFIPAAREMKRLRSAFRSPILSNLQESVHGLETIRAFGETDRFTHKNTLILKKFNVASYSDISIKRWLSMRINAISATVLFFTSAFILTTLFGEPFTPALVGFVMTYAMNITYTISAIIRVWAELETRSIALERLLEYCRIPTEAAMEIEETRPPISWPQKGGIKFINYSTRYRENLDPVLKNISVDIAPQEKVGIVGRTGAGKSSLTLALFRIIEATEGHIEIDGVNTSELGLFDLRRHLSIIPQDSQTIEGTVRQNLDPFSQYTDTQLWRVLELAHLKDHVEQMETKPKGQENKDEEEDKDEEPEVVAKGLDAVVDEGGSNLSAGQKQLLCLARALLNPSTILVLDEATASVDVRTDKIIQETIRTEFKDRTILTVAHRLETIMDSDKIMVLDKGELKEFGAPQELLKNEQGIFYSLCKEGGHM
ncbi:Multiple drug resistance-associated protein-like transporter 1 [Meyerozyma sp. JA9]|nr:Multiple drug resistance-associated protein-like transporter 1 [Meyerozyma sp. JA9]